MSDAATPQSWPVLSAAERRALGVLVEKQKTTPDVYPMSLNALVTGCNQKSNRDPVMAVADHEVEETLENLQRQALVTRVESGRVDKWRHLLYEQWHVGKAEIAVLAELLLRGPQTEGDLRGRVSRMEPVDDLDALRAVCRPLAQRGLVVYLTPEGRRGTVLTHGFHDPHELERLKSRAGAAEAIVDVPRPSPPTATLPDAASPLAARIDHLQAETAELRKFIADLQQELAETRARLQELKAALGPPSPPA
ncbi:MAG TPA: DUF480 domain-containing protein [Gemmataceae bacterium]|jgi:hypothetical protein